MMKRETFAVDTIYVPVGRRTTLDPKRVEEIAHSMLADGQKTPILVRPDGARFVLVEGLHRLEAAKPSLASASTRGSIDAANAVKAVAFISPR
jgi:sulfiredoxin